MGLWLSSPNSKDMRWEKGCHGKFEEEKWRQCYGEHSCSEWFIIKRGWRHRQEPYLGFAIQSVFRGSL